MQSFFINSEIHRKDVPVSELRSPDLWAHHWETSRKTESSIGLLTGQWLMLSAEQSSFIRKCQNQATVVTDYSRFSTADWVMRTHFGEKPVACGTIGIAKVKLWSSSHFTCSLSSQIDLLCISWYHCSYHIPFVFRFSNNKLAFEMYQISQKQYDMVSENSQRESVCRKISGKIIRTSDPTYLSFGTFRFLIIGAVNSEYISSELCFFLINKCSVCIFVRWQYVQERRGGKVAGVPISREETNEEQRKQEKWEGITVKRG